MRLTCRGHSLLPHFKLEGPTRSGASEIDTTSAPTTVPSSVAGKPDDSNGDGVQGAEKENHPNVVTTEAISPHRSRATAAARSTTTRTGDPPYRRPPPPTQPPPLYFAHTEEEDDTRGATRSAGSADAPPPAEEEDRGGAWVGEQQRMRNAGRVALQGSSAIVSLLQALPQLQAAGEPSGSALDSGGGVVAALVSELSALLQAAAAGAGGGGGDGGWVPPPPPPPPQGVRTAAGQASPNPSMMSEMASVLGRPLADAEPAVRYLASSLVGCLGVSNSPTGVPLSWWMLDGRADDSIGKMPS